MVLGGPHEHAVVHRTMSKDKCGTTCRCVSREEVLADAHVDECPAAIEQRVFRCVGAFAQQSILFGRVQLVGL